MSTVTNTPPVAAPDLYASVPNSKAKAAEGSVEADTNKFLTLLVTQLKNQDPLNPLDNAQITSQLAQLSTVTGVNKLNTTLESLKASYQQSEALQASNMIGQGVLVEGDFVQLVEGKSILGFELGSSAEDVKVIITDPKTGKDVQIIELGANPAGTVPLIWDGVVDPTKLDKDGKPIKLPDGNYTFSVVATAGGEKLKDAKSLSFDTVASITTSAKDGIKLNLPNKGIVVMSDIKQIF